MHPLLLAVANPAKFTVTAVAPGFPLSLGAQEIMSALDLAVVGEGWFTGALNPVGRASDLGIKVGMGWW